MPARGGSKGVPNKNLRLVAGVPLVGSAVRRASQAGVMVDGYDHLVICSTDSAAIAEVAAAWGARVPFLRPPELSSDEAGSLDVALHAIDWFASQHGQEPDVLILVQPTSPLTQPSDLAAALRLHGGQSDDSVVTVTHAPHAAWSYLIENGNLAPLSHAADASRRQDAGRVVGLNGAGYVVTPSFLRKHRRFIVENHTRPSLMDPDRSIDVDSESDLVACDAIARARPVRSLSVGARKIGPGLPSYVIAEAGVNHNGDVSLAHRLIDAAADAGADAVKFQTFNPASLVAADAPKADYQKQATGAAESQRTMLEALTLSRAAHRELAAHTRERGIEFLSSPFDEESADFLRELDLPAFKIPSGEITNFPFLRRVAAYGRPMLISTGMCDMGEVARAMDVVRDAGDPPVGLFHCVSNYPADARSANLRAMLSLQSAFGVPTGWSDHTLGIDVALAAAALGASLFEKHLTLSRDLPGPDHRASLEPEEFAAMVRGIRSVESSLGDGIKRPQAEELSTRAVARKSLHWSRDLKQGHRIEASDFACLRPGTGFPPVSMDDLKGSRLANDVHQGRMVVAADAVPEEIE